jgi:hypothetical protein
MTPDQNSPPSPPEELELDAPDTEAEAPADDDLDARIADMTRRENELAEREKLAALALAEANLALRTLDVERAEQQAAALAAGRSGGIRSGDIRSETVTQPLRQRRYKGGDMPNEFDVPMDQIPAGMSYQWNVHTIFGQENHSMNAHMQMQGWEPVHSSRHPHLCPKDYDGPIIVKGQILMERPMELTQEALQEDYDRARGEVRMKEEQLYGARPDTPVGKQLGIKKEFEHPTAELPRNYQYEGGGPVIE